MAGFRGSSPKRQWGRKVAPNLRVSVVFHLEGRDVHQFVVFVPRVVEDVHMFSMCIPYACWAQAPPADCQPTVLQSRAVIYVYTSARSAGTKIDLGMHELWVLGSGLFRHVSYRLGRNVTLYRLLVR